ncbi:hypothetical protein [Chryseobacterium glaciei]|nr:hypothetical protein [Chryseobacterium glaciei]
MKKIFLSLFAMIAIGLHAQNKMNIFNYTAYNLSNFLVGSDQTNNCIPNISGTNYPVMVPPMGAVTYNGYYNSHLQSPPINTWTVQINPTTTLPPQAPTSPLLISLGSVTKWQMNKFFVDDPSGAPLYYSGASIGMIGCNTPIISTLTPTAAQPFPFNAFWFDVGTDTYFIIQP